MLSSASRSDNFDKWLGLFIGATSCIAFLSFTKWRKLSRQKVLISRKKDGGVNIGAIFGMDIGGTLTKIVYFEANMNSSPKSSKGLSGFMESEYFAGFRKNKSFVDVEEPEQKAALRKLYELMENEADKAIRDELLTFNSRLLGGKIHFLHFETRNIQRLIDYLSSTAITENIKTIGCTGGGGHKYAKQFAEQLAIKVVPHDELGCLVRGMDFTLTNFANECYTYRKSSSASSAKTDTNPVQSNITSKGPEDQQWQKDVKEDMTEFVLSKELFVSNEIFPYLVVNIGSGVSILKVTSPGKFERVSGSSLGGGTYWGLCRLLTSANSYDNVLDLAETGNAGEVDMLVKDIYGGSYDQMNLNASMVASSFGKLVMKANPRENVKEEDLAIALLMMITNNIGQVAYLNAQLHSCRKIFFVGSFLRHNSISCRRLAFAIDFWSGGKMEALFLKHEGYFGALGTFLQSAFENDLTNILDLGHYGDELKREGSSADDIEIERRSEKVESQRHQSADPYQRNRHRVNSEGGGGVRIGSADRLADHSYVAAAWKELKSLDWTKRSPPKK